MLIFTAIASLDMAMMRIFLLGSADRVWKMKKMSILLSSTGWLKINNLQLQLRYHSRS
jgi:hypothetical protein